MQTRKRELAAQLTSGLAHDFANLLTIILGLQGRLCAPARPACGGRRDRARHDRRGPARRHAAGADRRNLGPSRVARRADEPRLAARRSADDGAPGPAGRSRLQVTLEPGLGPVLLDPGALQDSLLNLILNARDAIGPSGGTIRLDVRAAARHLDRDHRRGYRTRLFRGGAASRDRAILHHQGGEGSGLGLAMVYDQTSLAGGSMRLANRPEGGARVTLRLPLRAAGPCRIAPGPAGRGRSRHPHRHARDALRDRAQRDRGGEKRRGCARPGAARRAGNDPVGHQPAGGETGLDLLRRCARACRAWRWG
jgi:signal transduction histidine kinase